MTITDDKAAPRCGVYDDLTNAEYHSSIGISKSDLDLLHRSPAHYMAAKTQPRQETDAMRLGTAFHAVVLEPDTFGSRFAVAPDVDRRTKAGKEAWAAFEAECADGNRTIIKDADLRTVLAMKDSVMANKIARHLIENSAHELSVYGRIGGEVCKCRPDGWLRDDGIILDLKSAMDASAAGFQRAVANGRYHVQDAWYRSVIQRATGQEIEGFYFIACEKEPPYAMAIYQLDIDAVRQGYDEALADLNAYHNAQTFGKWSAYPDQIQTLQLPRWRRFN